MNIDKAVAVFPEGMFILGGGNYFLNIAVLKGLIYFLCFRLLILCVLFSKFTLNFNHKMVYFQK